MKLNKALLQFIRISFSVLLIVATVYCSIHFGKIGYEFGYRVFTEPAVAEEPGRDVLIQIKEGMSKHEIGQMLEQRGLVRDGNLFWIQLMLSAYADKMKPGVYTLNTSMDAKELMYTVAGAAAQEDTEAEASDAS